MLLELPEHAKSLFATLQKAGGKGYVVGGALRDLLLGNAPKDWDFAATLPTEKLLAVLPGAKLIGGQCGTVQVPFGDDVCEVTPCRTEGVYSDKRHPDEVHFVTDIRADLARRDFTINAMAYDGAVLLDPFNGQQDLAARSLRCVGEPAQRFAEDPLRILRLYRLAGMLGFTIEIKTARAAADAVQDIATLSRERVRDEMDRLLLSPFPAGLAPLLRQGGLQAFGLQYSEPLASLGVVPAKRLCRWWALFILCDADFATTEKAFGFSRRFIAAMAQYTCLYRLGPAPAKVWLKQKISTSTISYMPAAETFAALSPDFAPEVQWLREVQENKEPYRLAHLAINGDMLRYEGIKGEFCGQVLHELLQAVIKDPALNTPQALLGIAKGLKQILEGETPQ